MSTGRQRTSKYAAVAPAQARAYTLARKLGNVLGDSTTTDRDGTPLAWAVDVRRDERDMTALVLAGARGCPTVFALEIGVPLAALGLVMGKALALASVGKKLEAGALVTPEPEHFGTSVDPAQIPGSYRLVPATQIDPKLDGPDLLGAVSGTSSAAVRGPLAKLEASLRRLARLQESEAPVVMRDNEVRLARQLLARLEAQGWDRAADPLPPDLAKLAAALSRK